ncbi:unnamed protein product [Didymodactylos carnosus]|uniref:Polymerase/histidinol phosphatase N-terminal domain-containing protein n=1 Tax=Didymodactylos carnosus TaxID=1234261 RepID=A0A8S2ES93_9BILA|nr:unnamed protein product [Didymodactylos carnosus]CAF4031952.1 unnamed protein product [Didymodactylos carnosus]
MAFVNLNAKSHYTLLTSLLSPKAIVAHALKDGQTYAALADTVSMAGAYEFYKACVQAKLKPVIGLEVAYQQGQLLIIAKNYFGYQRLMEISSAEMSEQK